MKNLRLCIDHKAQRVFAGVQKEYMGVLSLEPALLKVEESLNGGTNFTLSELDRFTTHLIALCSFLPPAEKHVASSHLQGIGKVLAGKVNVLLRAESQKIQDPNWEYRTEEAICELLNRIDQIQVRLKDYHSGDDIDYSYWKNLLLMGWIERRHLENHVAIGKMMGATLSQGKQFAVDLATAPVLDEKRRATFLEWRDKELQGGMALNSLVYKLPAMRTYVAEIMLRNFRRIEALENQGRQIVADKFREWEETTSGKAAVIARGNLEKKLGAATVPNGVVKTKLIQEILPKLRNQIENLGRLLEALAKVKTVIPVGKVEAIRDCLIRLEGLFGRGIQPFLTGPEVEKLIEEGGELPEALKNCIYFWVWKTLAPQDNKDPDFGKNRFNPEMLKGKGKEIADLWIERAFDQYLRNMIEQGPDIIRVLNELSDLSVRNTAGLTASDEFAQAMKSLEQLGLENPRTNFNPYAIGFQFGTSRFSMPLAEIIERTGDRRLLDLYQGLKQVSARANLTV